MTTEIAVAKGDGIGPEIMEAVLRIFESAGVPCTYHFVEMSRSVFDQGFSTGMTPEAKATIEDLGILFKGPMETPKGKGVKSINVTARKVWNTYANVRRFRSIKGVDTVFSRAGININMTILRENIEDTYGGIEYMHNQDVAVCYRLITRPGSEQFVRFCFDYAVRQGHTQITCGHKSNIMKQTDGLFMNVFYEVAKEYPQLQANDVIVDDLAMKLVRMPDKFQLVILPNLQGDIISDLCAGLVGGLGFAPSANIGDSISIFEAVHGTAPDIAGKKLANPTSLLLSGIMMLRHLGKISYADTIENALLKTLEDGIHTGDFGAAGSTPVNTDQFADALIKNLGNKPHQDAVNTNTADFEFKRPEKRTFNRVFPESSNDNEVIDGVDMFVTSDLQAAGVAALIEPKLSDKFMLRMISNRGTQVYPQGSVYTDCVPHYRVRLEKKSEITRADIFNQMAVLTETVQIEDAEILKSWGDVRGYALAQGQ